MVLFHRGVSVLGRFAVPHSLTVDTTRGNDLWPRLRADFSHRRKAVSGRILDITENPL
jgi:hypothetical protein